MFKLGYKELRSINKGLFQTASLSSPQMKSTTDTITWERQRTSSTASDLLANTEVWTDQRGIMATRHVTIT